MPEEDSYIERMDLGPSFGKRFANWARIIAPSVYEGVRRVRLECGTKQHIRKGKWVKTYNPMDLTPHQARRLADRLIVWSLFVEGEVDLKDTDRDNPANGCNMCDLAPGSFDLTHLCDGCLLEITGEGKEALEEVNAALLAACELAYQDMTDPSIQTDVAKTRRLLDEAITKAKGR